MTMPTPRLAAVAAMLGLVVATTPAIASAGPDRRADAVSVLEAAPAPERVTGTLPSTAVRSRFVEVADDDLTGLQTGAPVSFELFPREVVTGTVDSVSRDEGATSWNGSLDEGGSWFASRVKGTFHMTLQTAEGGFEVASAGDDTYRVVETEAPELRGTDEVAVPTSRGRATTEDADGSAARGDARSMPRSGEPAESASGDVGNVVDILFVITAAARAAAGSDEAVEAQVATAVAQMNSALQRSGVPGQVRRAGLVYSSTVEAGGDLVFDLRRVKTPGDGLYDEATAAREASHADMVSLWIEGDPTMARVCGRGFLAPDESWAFHTVFRTCATDPATYTFAHEAGHNFKLSHDANASEAPSPESPVYARGFVDLPAKVYTVMAYHSQCTTAGIYCTKLLNYSNPAVLENGRPTGTDLANNARALAEQFAVVANYRQERIYGTAPVITGTPRFRGKLRIEPGAWQPGTTGLSYQWYADGVVMPGRTERTMRVTRWMIGRTITVLVTGQAPYYAPLSLASAPTPPMAKALFRKRRVVLKGKARVGHVLKVRTKIRPRTKKISYQWYRGGKRIKGAKNRTYRLRRADRGKKIHVRVKVRKKGYASLVKRTKKRKVRR